MTTLDAPATQAANAPVAVIDMANITQVIATIASAERFGPTYAKCRLARAGVIVEQAAAFRYNCGNYFVRVHQWDRKVRV